MRHIEENRKARVIKEFLNGLSFDEIAKQVGVSHGSVVNIINEFRDGTLPLPQGVSGYIDELRRLVVDLKKHGTTVPRLNAYVKIHAKLRDMGVDINRVELWLDICEKVACHEAFSNEIVESALELERLSSETNLSYKSLIQDYRQKLEESKALDRKIEEKRNELDEMKLKYEGEKERVKKTLDSITRAMATAQDNFDKQKKDLRSQLDEYLKQNRLSWRRIKTVEGVIDSGLNASDLTQEQKKRLHKKIADTGSILIVIKKLEQERDSLKSEVSRLAEKKGAYASSIDELEHTDSGLRASIAERVIERDKLNSELESKRARLIELRQEISEKIEELCMSRLILDFLFNPYCIKKDDLDRLVSIVITMRQNWLVKQAKDRRGRVIGERQVPGVYDDFSANKVDIDTIRSALAYMLTPLVKDKFVSRVHYDMAKLGYEVVQTAPKTFSYRPIQKGKGGGLVLLSPETLFD